MPFESTVSLFKPELLMMRLRVLAGGFSLSLLLAAPLVADVSPSAFVIRNFGVEAGLPHPSVRVISQAADGHLWVATPAGLATFDGIRFELMEGSGVDSLRQASALGPAAGGGMWVGTREGGLWHGKGGAWREELPAGTLAGAGGIVRVIEDRDGAVWLQAGGAVACYRAGRVVMASDGWAGGVFSLDEGPDRSVRVATREGLAEVSVEGALRPVFAISEALGMRYVGGTSGGRHWVAGVDGLRLCRSPADLQEAALVPPPLWCEAHQSSFVTDGRGGLWVGVSCEGLMHVSTAGEVHRLGEADGLAAEAVKAVFRDREGLLWVGAQGGGLSRVTPRVFLPRGVEEGMGAVTALHADGKGRLFGASSERGIFQWHEDRLDEIAQPMEPTEGGKVPVEISALARLANGALLAGTARKGLLEIGRKRAMRVGDIPDAEARIGSLLAEADGGLWIGRSGDPPLLRVHDGSLASIPLGDGGVAVRCLLRGEGGRVWVGTERHGLMGWKDGELSVVGFPPGIAPVTIRALAESAGTLWVASAGAGLWRWKGERLRACREADGLPEDRLSALRADGRGGLWVAGEQSWFHLGESLLDAWFDGLAPCPGATRFGKEDGLAGWRPAAGRGEGSAATTDGRLWFAADPGLLEVRPERFVPSTAKPLAAVEALFADGVAVPAGERLPRGTRRVELRFKGLLLEDPEGLRYETRLDPVENRWVARDGGTSVAFRDLRPGAYRFAVRVVDRRGRVSEQPALLAFELPVPMWREPWVQGLAYAGLLPLVVLGTRGVMALRMRREAARVAIERALAEERARISRDMHDDISVGLTELALLGDRLAEGETPGEEARQVSRRSRELMDAMNEAIWLLHPRQDSLEDMASFLQRSVRRWTAASGLACRFDLCADFSRQNLAPEVRRSILLACKEAVHNVIRHARARRILIAVREEGGNFVVSIEDDGIGLGGRKRPEGQTTDGGGNGLPNMRHRMESVGGSVRFEVPPQGGTRVSLVFPCISRLPVTQPLHRPDS